MNRRDLCLLARRQGIPVYLSRGADRIGSDVPPLRRSSGANSGTDTCAGHGLSIILAGTSPDAPPTLYPSAIAQ